MAACCEVAAEEATAAGVDVAAGIDVAARVAMVVVALAPPPVQGVHGSLHVMGQCRCSFFENGQRFCDAAVAQLSGSTSTEQQGAAVTVRPCAWMHSRNTARRAAPPKPTQTSAVPVVLVALQNGMTAGPQRTSASGSGLSLLIIMGPHACSGPRSECISSGPCRLSGSPASHFLWVRLSERLPAFHFLCTVALAF